MTERERFRKWMSDNRIACYECPYTGRYETPEVRTAWSAWQARAELAEAELARIATEPDTGLWIRTDRTREVEQ